MVVDDRSSEHQDLSYDNESDAQALSNQTPPGREGSIPQTNQHDYSQDDSLEE